MAFPADVLDLVTEIFVGGQWQDISTDVLTRDGVTIKQGRSGRDGQVPPCATQMTLSNVTGDYSPRNPLGQWYGSLGRNTPLRQSIRVGRDTFTRTAVDSWGTSDTGQAWTIAANPADFDVAAGVGTVNVPAAATTRLSYLAAESYQDVDLSVSVTLPVTNITGGEANPACLVVRGLSTTDYYHVQIGITTAEAVQIGVRHADGTVLVAQTTVTGLTHTSAQALRVRMQAEGETIRAKIWAEASGEPYDWQVAATGVPLRSGWVGIRTGLGTGSTNAPMVMSYDSWEIRRPRIAAEVSEWPPKWDLSENDAYVPLEGSGILRRLGQGAPTVTSTLRRGLENTGSVVAYWPCEDGENSTVIASGIPGGLPMNYTGEPRFAQNDDFVASDSLPTFDGSEWGGHVSAYSNPDAQTQVRFLLSIPEAGDTAANGFTVARVHTNGSAAIWDMQYTTASNGSITLNIYDSSQVLLHTTGAVSFNLHGRPCRVSLELDQVGANIDWDLSTIEPSGTAGGISGTLAGRTVGLTTGVLLGVNRGFTTTAVGHVSVQNAITAIDELSDQLAAHDGETAGVRFVRLCEEQGVPVSYVGTLSATAAMGPQGVDTLLDLLTECVEADLGYMYEARGTLGLVFRSRESLYSQAALLTVDHDLGQLASPFEPVDDDSETRNDITAKRVDGSSYRVTQETGPLSVLPPEDGGVGRYPTTATVNVNADRQLPDIAGWLRHLGTVDEARYPHLTVNLARSPELSMSAMDADVGDRIAVINLASLNIYDDISQQVLGYTEHLDNKHHKIVFACIPESAYQIVVLDDGVSKAGSGSSTLTSGVTSSATSLSVTSTAELWTTSAGQMPISIMVGGEEMTVTAISGASSPQTFTVARSVNGVVKPHSAGAQLKLARRATLAL